MMARESSVRPDRFFAARGRFSRIKRRKRPKRGESMRRAMAGHQAAGTTDGETWLQFSKEAARA